MPKADYDLYTKIEPSEADKEVSSKLCASRRAFNGAPPIIPHPVENTTDAACYACHSGGVQLAGMKASVMLGRHGIHSPLADQLHPVPRAVGNARSDARYGWGPDFAATGRGCELMLAKTGRKLLVKTGVRSGDYFQNIQRVISYLKNETEKHD